MAVRSGAIRAFVCSDRMVVYQQASRPIPVSMGVEVFRYRRLVVNGVLS